jgi:hypothetical protein
MNRRQGLVDLLRDGFVAGTGALERVQKETAAVPFAVLEAVPVLRAPARMVHQVHDATVTLTYAAVRVVGQAVGLGLDRALAAVGEPRTCAERAEGTEPGGT